MVEKKAPRAAAKTEKAVSKKDTVSKVGTAETFPVQAIAEYAIIKTGGKQYQAIKGKTLAVEKLDVEPGKSVTFDEVLFRKSGEGKFEVGQPLVKGAVVKASVIKHDREPKVVVFRFKRRKKSRVKRGHRQPMTIVRIEAI